MKLLYRDSSENYESFVRYVGYLILENSHLIQGTIYFENIYWIIHMHYPYDY